MIIYPVIIPECNGDYPLWYVAFLIVLFAAEIALVIWAVWRFR